MVKKASKNRKVSFRNEAFHRYWTGLTIVSVILTVVASALAGTRTVQLLYRLALVYLVLAVIGRILIRTWSSLEDMKRGENKASRK